MAIIEARFFNQESPRLPMSSVLRGEGVFSSHTPENRMVVGGDFVFVPDLQEGSYADGNSENLHAMTQIGAAKDPEVAFEEEAGNMHMHGMYVSAEAWNRLQRSVHIRATHDVLVLVARRNPNQDANAGDIAYTTIGEQGLRGERRHTREQRIPVEPGDRVIVLRVDADPHGADKERTKQGRHIPHRLLLADEQSSDDVEAIQRAFDSEKEGIPFDQIPQTLAARLPSLRFHAIDLAIPSTDYLQTYGLINSTRHWANEHRFSRMRSHIADALEQDIEKPLSFRRGVTLRGQVLEKTSKAREALTHVFPKREGYLGSEERIQITDHTLGERVWLRARRNTLGDVTMETIRVKDATVLLQATIRKNGDTSISITYPGDLTAHNPNVQDAHDLPQTTGEVFNHLAHEFTRLRLW